MDLTPNESWRSNSASTSSGRFSEPVLNREHRTFSEETKDNTELILMRLRRLSIGLMSKNERLRYSGRRLCRSNVFQFLSNYLSHSSEKVRYLCLEVLCFTVVRLGTKTDTLLKPVMPKVVQCLRENEDKDIKRKALHFLRVYFRYTKSPSGFIEDFVTIGIENENPNIRNACFYGLNIIFDKDIGSSLFAHVVVSVMSHISNGNINIASYRALKHVHQTIGDDRFIELMTLADKGCVDIYMNVYDYEESDALLSMEGNNCTSVVSTYILKRVHMGFKKDFGILDASFLNYVLETRNCERAKAVGYLTDALKETLWVDTDLEPHLADFLILVESFIDNSNRLIQMCGFSILKETISRMGFTLSPHIRFLVKMLRRTLTSANSKIKSKTDKIVHKLMRNIHVMTVIWELLNTQDSPEKESVLILLQEKIRQFPYHELDMIPLCNFLGKSLEDKNSSVAKHSRTCISQLLDIMRECPIYGNRTETIKVLLRNYHLNRETLKDIDALELCGDDHLEGTDSCSDHEIKERAMEKGFLENSEIGESEEALNTNNPYVRSRYHLMDAISPATEKIRKSLFISAEHKEKINGLKSSGKSEKDFLNDFQIKRLPSYDNPTPLEYCCNHNIDILMKNDHRSTEREKRGLFRDLNSRNRQRTRFCMKRNSVDVEQECFQDEIATGDTEVTSSSASLGTGKDNNDLQHMRYVTESYEQDGIHVDVMRKDIFNFNIIKVESPENTNSIQEVYSDSQEFEESIKSNIDIDTSTHVSVSSPLIEIPSSPTERNIAPYSPVSSTVPHTPDSVTMSSKSPDNITPFMVSNIKTRQFTQTGSSNAEFDKFSDENMSETDVDISPYVQEHLKINNANCEHNKDLHRERNPLKYTISEAGSDTEINIRHVSTNSEQLLSSCNLVQHEVIKDTSTPENPLICNNHEQNVTEISEKSYVLSCNESETPFLPKSRQLPRTPTEKVPDNPLGVQAKVSKKAKRLVRAKNRNKARDRVRNRTAEGCEYTTEESEKHSGYHCNTESKQSEIEIFLRQSSFSKHNCTLNWGGCQWRRDLEYAAKATTCSWTEQFEEMVKSIGPLPSLDAAEIEMKKAVDDLFNGTWTVKEDAMLKVIRLAKHHQILVSENTNKIALALSNEIKNFRQSVAGKAILTTGHLYEIMGKQFENKLRPVVGALLAKSGTRTLAAYYRLVVKSLAKIAIATSPQKAAMAFIQEGSKQANKAARETAAQFLCILTEQLGTDNSMVPSLSSHMLKCAAMFVFDSSALTRYCGKRMFRIFTKHPDFEKLKDHHLEVDLAQDLDKILDQLRIKGVKNEILPIHLIE